MDLDSLLAACPSRFLLHASRAPWRYVEDDSDVTQMHVVRGTSVRSRLLTLVLVTTCGLLGCRSTGDVSREPPEASDWICPQDVPQQMHLKTTVIRRPRSADMATSESFSTAHNALARRVLVSVEPAPELAGVRVLSSNLTMIVFGGTLQSWIDGSNPTTHTEPRAIEIDRSTYHVKPFLTEGSLGPQSRSIDFVVSPGGVPIDSLQISLGSLWNADHSPVQPEAAGLTVVPLRYLTTYSRVEADVTLEIVGLPAGPQRSGWKCPVEQRATLVDIDSVRPPLWDIGMPDPPGGTRKRWLALNSNASGPFRAIFSSPTVAANFLAWLRKIRVTRIGQFDLGVFRPMRPSVAADDILLSNDRDIMASYTKLAIEDLERLQVGSLDEP